jgi:hypothetical protein
VVLAVHAVLQLLLEELADAGAGRHADVVLAPREDGGPVEGAVLLEEVPHAGVTHGRDLGRRSRAAPLTLPARSKPATQAFTTVLT